MSNPFEKPKHIGAMWTHFSKAKNAKYYSGVIEVDDEKIEFIAMENNYRKSDKSPDYLIYPPKPREQK